MHLANKFRPDLEWRRISRPATLAMDGRAEHLNRIVVGSIQMQHKGLATLEAHVA
jgi:hypothetical protein